MQAHPYFRGLDWQMLLRRDVAMDKDWIPLIDERDGVQVIYCLFVCLCRVARQAHSSRQLRYPSHCTLLLELRPAVDRAGPQTGAAGKWQWFRV